MNDTLSTPEPAEQVDEIRRIIHNRGARSCEATLFAVRQVVFPPPEPPDTRLLATDDNGWPILNAEGTAWERHDDPHGDDPDTRS